MGEIQIGETFPALFAEPSIERLLHELGDIEFEHFVGYVFQQAGYFVDHTGNQHGPGLDLKVSLGPGASRARHAGVQVKHFVPTHRVGAHDVTHLRGGLPVGANVVGYFVTTSSFQSLALEEAKRPRRIWPIDGDHFVRYINYVRGTRQAAKSAAAQTKQQQNGMSPPIPAEAFFAADGIERRFVDSTKVLTVANHKGGVGKTTTALNLAFGLAGQDRQVLLIDMDAQANLTRALGYPQSPEATPRHIGEYFAGDRSLTDLITPTQFKRVWLIPAHYNLVRSDKGLDAGPAAELMFAQDLHSSAVAPPDVLTARPFDWIIIDTGPWMGYFTRSALAASHYVLMPISPSVFADMGLEFLLETVGTMNALTGNTAKILGCLVTMWRDDALNRSLLAKAEALLDLARIPRLQTEIPLDKANIERAHLETGQGRERNLFDRRCASAKAYLKVIAEVLSHVQPGPSSQEQAGATNHVHARGRE
jgi:chromosome partitioning protein